MTNTNLEMLHIAVAELGDLADEMVFVGGATTGLLITDEGAADVRPTDDVDSIVEATTYVEYLRFTDRLKQKGFSIDTRKDAPLCRWVKNNIVLDVMPLKENILGFANKWYKQAITDPRIVKLSATRTIRGLTSPYFLCHKAGSIRRAGK